MYKPGSGNIYEILYGRKKDDIDKIKDMIRFISKNLDALSKKEIRKFEKIKLEYHSTGDISSLDLRFLHSCVYRINNDY